MKRIAAILLGCLLVGSGNVEGASFSPLWQGCDGFNSRVNVGDFALVTSPALNIRGAPGTDAERLRDPLEPGTLASINQGPECVDGYTWWQVTAEGTQGWVAEGNPDVYFLSGPVDPNQVAQQDSDFDISGDANPNPPLSTLDGKPGGGNYRYVCRGVSEGIIARDPYTSDDVNSGGLIGFTPFLNMLEVDTPAVCLGPNIPVNSNSVAVAPDGRAYEPVVTPVYEDDNDDGGGGDLQYTLVQLPLQAFFQFGRWRLEASGFILEIDVRPPGQPYVLYTFADGGQMIIAGMKPNERFIASGTGDDGDTIRWFEAQANNNGAFVTPLSQLPWFQDLPDYDTNYLYDSVAQTDIIGQMGSFVTLEGVTVEDPETGEEWYSIPIRHAAPLMREIVWGGQYDEGSAQNLLLSWTCPGASPIRLRRDTGATVAGDAGTQRIYLRPTVNSEVYTTADPGDTYYLLDGIECADNGVWWYNGDGWLMESQGNRYFWHPD